MAKIMIGTPNYTAMMDSAVASRVAQICTNLKGQGHEVAWMVVRRTFICKARHEVAWAAKEWKADWLLWIDDDAIPPKDIFDRLSKHDKDIVITPYPMRTAPYQCGVLCSKDQELTNPYSYYNVEWENLKKGLIEVDGGGTHCMLTKASVYGDPMNEEEFKKFQENENDGLAMYAARCPGQIPYPWFVLAPLGGTEDMYFCLTGRRLGIKIYCDSDVEAAHIGYPQVLTSEDYKQWKSLSAASSSQNGSKKLPEEFRSIDALRVVDSEGNAILKSISDAPVGQGGSQAQVA